MALSAIARGAKLVQTVQRFNKKYQYINPTDKFIRKYVPPNYRSKATRFARYAEAGSFGGLAYEIAQDLLSDGTTNPNAQIRTKKDPSSSKFQTRGRFRRRPKWCRCKPKRYS